ncbi:hypothetical protein MTX78_20365 [Hymenobacter tibetensis]|uniref:Lipoprotein n=1 Tax=Hymenobacter tibetensis TaxID=497967 RepID=A0ABY4CWK1_9BACT|nr:hypothetical protein [Hymenobacter tibetensis]UOG74461.1 hypothetical protein MTX78_20365 [Hymenobacter tibetensis]
MKSFTTAILLSAAMLFSGCDDDDTAPGGSAIENFSKAIMVSEGGAPPYILGEVRVGETLYRGTQASFQVSGKLQSGPVISLSFQQSSRTTTGTDKTDVVAARINTTTNATQASGTTLRDPKTNTVTGTFSSTFPNGLTVDGTITNLQLQ